MKNTTHRTRLLLLTLGVAAVFVAVTVFAVSSSHRQAPAAAGINPAALSLAPTVPGLAAADSDTVVLAPHTGEWWKKITAMAPASMGLLPLDPAGAGAPVLRLGYSRGPDHAVHEIPNTGPLRLVYLEAASAGDADIIATWLKNQPRYDNRRVHVQDRTVIVGQSWDSTYAVPEQAIQTVAAYRPGNATAQGSMWLNVDQEIVALTGGADTKSGKVYSAILSKGLGFKPGTTWIGFSDNGDDWSGDFAAGGVDKAQISFDDARAVLDADKKVLAEGKDGNVTTRLIDAGTGTLMNGTAITANGETLGGASTKHFPMVDGQIVSLVNNVTTWTSAATGAYSGPESIIQRTLSANEKSMVIGYSYGSGDPAAATGQSPFGAGIGNPTK
ncbi:hypothetical protein [Pseudarthrobacter sp. BIM B-2242]|uniref:hypothetical protein n=1 Tax=Pseudarthrobacter sp. BIM B-2242 TaxID=2772401 RepID=UPI00168A53A8|nr:hypothetical protein [Pseudarthrobacter sp. BIM B-2242]QOD05730.1 hypothetical protein IDT60_22070 [Pseudarthrobacter sp. BIM B-2242]